jgi:hypothetical protein
MGVEVGDDRDEKRDADERSDESKAVGRDDIDADGADDEEGRERRTEEKAADQDDEAEEGRWEEEEEEEEEGSRSGRRPYADEEDEEEDRMRDGHCDGSGDDTRCRSVTAAAASATVTAEEGALTSP